MGTISNEEVETLQRQNREKTAQIEARIIVLEFDVQELKLKLKEKT